MAKKSNWNDDYWLLVVQLYLRKPVGVKPLYSKALIDRCLESHVARSEVRAKMKAVDKLQLPRVERLWRTYSGNPAKLRRAVELLRQMKGFGNANEFFEGVAVNEESFERDFRPLDEDKSLTPMMLILILDLYFRLSVLTLVAETPEVIELSKMMKVSASKTSEVLNVVTYGGPSLNRQDMIVSRRLGPCNGRWSQYGNWSLEQLSDYAGQLKEYFKS